MRTETVTVHTEDGKEPLIINKEDFNPEKHTLWDTTAIAPEAPQQQGEPQQQGDDPGYFVTKAADGKKFVVIDKNMIPVQRDGIDAAGYKTEKAAWEAIKAL